MARLTKVRKTRDGRYEAFWFYRGHWAKLSGWYWDRKSARAALDEQLDSIRVLNSRRFDP